MERINYRSKKLFVYRYKMEVERDEMLINENDMEAYELRKESIQSENHIQHAKDGTAFI